MSGPLLTEDQAARILAVRVATLRYWRKHRIGPAVVKMGRVYRYRDTDLQAFIAANRRAEQPSGQVIS